jgi:hypothetical protein
MGNRFGSARTFVQGVSLALVLGLVAASCTTKNVGSAPESKGVIDGNVRDGQGTGIGGAQVSAAGPSGHADGGADRHDRRERPGPVLECPRRWL